MNIHYNRPRSCCQVIRISTRRRGTLIKHGYEWKIDPCCFQGASWWESHTAWRSLMCSKDWFPFMSYLLPVPSPACCSSATFTHSFRSTYRRASLQVTKCDVWRNSMISEETLEKATPMHDLIVAIWLDARITLAMRTRSVHHPLSLWTCLRADVIWPIYSESCHMHTLGRPRHTMMFNDMVTDIVP